MFDRVVIIDESQTQPSTEVLSNERPRAFVPIFSNRGYGKDSEIKLFDGFTHSQLTQRYGTPDLGVTLAPLYYAWQYLRAGGDVYIRRITAADSNYSHAVIIAKGKIEAGTDPDPDRYQVQFEIQTIADVTDLEALVSDAEALYTGTADVDGFTSFPLAVVGLNWAGKEGNQYTFRLLPDKTLEKSIPERGYNLELRRNVTAIPQSIAFSTDENATLGGVSIYANDYVEDNIPDVFFKVLSTYNTYLGVIAPFVPAGETYPDVFFGKSKANVAYPNYYIGGQSADLTAVGGVVLAGGSDGNFDLSEANRTSNMLARLAESYTEEPTLHLLNEYKYFVDEVYDFGASQDVKDAIVAFVNSRDTGIALVDTGLERSATAILNSRLSGGLSYNDSRTFIFGGSATARDPFNNKKRQMPLSYFEAFAAPNHIGTYGGHRPFAGSTYVYPDMVAGTYAPAFYDENAEIVEQFVDNRINFAMEDVNQYTAFHQSSSLKIDSSLNQRNNVYLLNRLIRIGLITAKANRWNFLEDTDIEQYQSTLIQNIGTELEGKFGEFELQAQRESEIGPGRNRVLVTGQVRFKNINTGTTFRFTVV